MSITLQVVSVTTEELPNQMSSGKFFFSSNTFRAKESYRPTSTPPPCSQPLYRSSCLSSVMLTPRWDRSSVSRAGQKVTASPFPLGEAEIIQQNSMTTGGREKEASGGSRGLQVGDYQMETN